jgi:FAD/FMN-containing dehydrogenase
MPDAPLAIENFGGNLRFQPLAVVQPQCERDVLDALQAYRGRRVRVIGRLHSWSAAAVGDELVLDLRRMNLVRTEARDGRIWATVEAGCQIKRLLAELERQAGATLPSVGLISEQTIAGAISTGTHGSGKQSLSHFIEEVRIACYDPATSEPIIRTINDGDELRAARCALGSLGVIVSVGLWCRPQYVVEEHFRRYESLDAVLEQEEEYPLQQFFLIPWLWSYWAQHRREVNAPRSAWAWLYRLYWFAVIDVGFHVVLVAIWRWLRARRLVKGFYRRIMPWTVVRGWRVRDRSQAMLVMEHELFRHIEIEVFVARRHLAAALAFSQELLRWCDGDAEALSPDTRKELSAQGLLDAVDAVRGRYLHHYPICVRRVLPDDALISMTAGRDEPCDALSFISYVHPTDRAGFFAFADVLAKTMTRMFDARPHWGKVCPIDAEDAARLYPELPKFVQRCEAADPDGVFRNDWTTRVLFAGRRRLPGGAAAGE